MRNIVFKIYHPELDIVSDRTFRKILKSLSKILREFQRQEIEYLISHIEISPSEKQSLRDRIKGPINHIDSYYLEKVERGSLTLIALLSTAALVLLQNTIGESLKDAWKKTECNEKLINWLSKPREFGREEFIDRNIDRVIDNWKFDEFILEDVQKNIIDDDTLEVVLSINTPDELSKHIKASYRKQDIDFILKELEKYRA